MVNGLGSCQRIVKETTKQEYVIFSYCRPQEHIVVIATSLFLSSYLLTNKTRI
jgi:hypothetical protein